MTKKDYELIASVLFDTMPEKDMYHFLERKIMWETNCRCLASAFEMENSRFNRQKFLKACGI